MHALRFPTVVVLAGLAAATGCGAGGGLKTHSVEGKIVYSDGQPAKELASGTVVFESAGGSPAIVARGVIKDDGAFRLGTTGASDGAPAGSYKVLIVPPRQQKDVDDPPSPPVIAARFEKFATSGLTATVEPKSNQITLTVERAKK